MNGYIEILAGYVFDDDKLVTYKWLSKELCVHVNIAKEILWEFHQKYHGSTNIECTYLLIGHLKEKGLRVEVVRGSNLSKAKEKFSKIISEHVYSIHKPIADLELLATSNSGDVNHSAIKCDACKERTDEEMQLLRWGTVAKKIAVESISTHSKSAGSLNLSKTGKNPMTKKNGFNNLFNMTEKSKNPEKLKSSFQENDRESMKNEKDNVEKDNFIQKHKNCSKDSAEKIKNLTEKKSSMTNSTPKKASPQNSMKKGSLDNFFGKLTSSRSIETASLEMKNDKNDKNIKKECTEGKINKEKKNLHRKKRNRSKETNEIAKKRKRIVIQSDSSDSEIQSDVEMEDPVSEMELEIPVKTKSPSPPKVKHENGRRKVLKLINKTYKEGEYIVTKKEHVYVSCSEDEEEKEETKKKEENKAEAKKEKVKKKQSTLTNFFKKC